jgi:hypothetical protein
MTVGTILVRAGGVAHLAREFVAVQGMLLNLAIGENSLVTTEAGGLGFIVQVGTHLAIAVERIILVAGDARHSEFHPMDIAIHAVIVAAILIADARAVAHHTRIAEGSHFFDRVSRQQAAVGGVGPTDVALAAGGVARGTVIVERLLGCWRVDIRPHRLEIIPVTILRGVQTCRYLLDDVAVAKAARLFRVGAGVLDDTLVGGGFIRNATRPAMARDATQLAVRGFHEFGIADEHLFPHFQWG